MLPQVRFAQHGNKKEIPKSSVHWEVGVPRDIPEGGTDMACQPKALILHIALVSTLTWATSHMNLGAVLFHSSIWIEWLIWVRQQGSLGAPRSLGARPGTGTECGGENLRNRE